MSFTIIFYFYLAFLSSVGELHIYAPPFHKPSPPIITVKLIFYSIILKKNIGVYFMGIPMQTG